MTAAPTAPGRLGQPLTPAEARAFLTDLDDWVRARRLELDDSDAAALAAGRGDEISSDMMLSLAVWQAVQQRYQLLNATFDGGRVGPIEAERLSTPVWGRLDGDLGNGPAVSLPEACRLSDALVGQIATKLALIPARRRECGPHQAAARQPRTRPRPGRPRAQLHPRRRPLHPRRAVATPRGHHRPRPAWRRRRWTPPSARG
ncbi:hypothetical protein LP418_25065 [Nocardioides sp. B-3]|nr:hypothetical protein LP418_25065 [Nocardioides sp. B-3]